MGRPPGVRAEASGRAGRGRRAEEGRRPAASPAVPFDALVVVDVLAALRGAELRYHGDFDWPGIAIANRLVAEAGVTPWRMSAADYERGLVGATLPLVGAPVEPAWDPELGAAMRHHRVAVHEEAVLSDLLDGST